ncbi:uncharacterized protein LOC142559556 [Dermacentor variabilis]|uniref:uncharacterized protein LOC142559556 n=1 Tax=Dermacentor variabilis TaxID=34621 RepID=UPI003F5B8515
MLSPSFKTLAGRLTKLLLERHLQLKRRSAFPPVARLPCVGNRTPIWRTPVRELKNGACAPTLVAMWATVVVPHSRSRSRGGGLQDGRRRRSLLTRETTGFLSVVGSRYQLILACEGGAGQGVR